MTSLAELVKRFGWSAKLVRAYCRERGWRYGKQGAPQEWYDEWPTIARGLIDGPNNN